MKIKYLGATCMALLLSIGMFSTTAFAYDSVFGKVIFKFYSGKRDSKTIEILYSNHN